MKEENSAEWFGLFLATSLYIKFKNYHEFFFSWNNFFLNSNPDVYKIVEMPIKCYNTIYNKMAEPTC